MKKYYWLFIIIIFIACKNKTDIATPINAGNGNYYFPPSNSDTWETVTPQSLGWDVNKLNEALAYAQSKNTYGFIILHKGKIVTENYWNGWNKDTRYYIASAGKSIVGLLVGIAQKEGILKISDKTSKYLGNGWTSCPQAKEDLITIKHQLSMTSGLDDGVADSDCRTPDCLKYKADAGTRWAYHNAAYHLLHDVLVKASGMTMNNYTKTKLADKIGMKNYTWLNYILGLNTRDMARFGSLILNKGTWNGQTVLNDTAYFDEMLHTSNTYNKSYGYLWWLNGKETLMVPTSQVVFKTPLAATAPADMVACLGKGDKKIYVIPSLDLVVIRHGDDTGTNLLGPSSFDTFLWEKLKLAIKY